MWPFSKMGAPEPDPIKPPARACQHKWTDIKDDDGNDLWYMEVSVYNDGDYKYEVVEPYVCIHCKERKDVVLEKRSWHVDSVNDAWNELKKIRKKYPQIKDRAIVENAINDLQLVDRHYLRIAANVMGVKF